ncbi:Large permease component (TRAP transporter) BbdB3 (plasmid) [Aminobacter sp. MSH1]|uniref:TRAP transporter large permease n=1 Tax=Aminobacter sp. MSH1 TaxID=374606 RepID=UPI000D3E8B0B|nr:TRAP transporter large permease [Aminobacter sp. MSH1]ARD70009.2 Large permease component (TRAP transporter) BbdB3 [Aminobacter sp. MSH1]
MAWYVSGLLMLLSILILMGIGLPIAFTFMAVSLFGAYVFMGGMFGLEQVVANASTAVSSFSLVPIPLFLLMGELFFHTGLAMRIFKSIDVLIGNMRGRLAYLSVISGTIFAMLSGSSMANTALLGGLLVPEMERQGYNRRIAIGPILGAGGLAMIIPPSALAVLLGSLAKIDIGALLIAGIVPGIVLAASYIAVIFAKIKFDPDCVPDVAPTSHSVKEKFQAIFLSLLPVSLIIMAVLGSLLGGFATPSEAAAIGAIAVFLLALSLGLVTLRVIAKSLIATVKVSAMILMIIVASSTFSQILAFSGISANVVNGTVSILDGQIAMMLGMLVVMVLLGMFMDQISMMLITIPIFIPIANTLGFDMVWFGIIMLLSLEVSLLTPPFGLALFVMLGVAPSGTTLGEIIAASLPYTACIFALIALVIVWPELATALPGLMM